MQSLNLDVLSELQQS